MNEIENLGNDVQELQLMVRNLTERVTVLEGMVLLPKPFGITDEVHEQTKAFKARCAVEQDSLIK